MANNKGFGQYVEAWKAQKAAEKQARKCGKRLGSLPTTPPKKDKTSYASLMAMSKSDLYSEACSLNIKGRSRMSKEQLAIALSAIR